MNDDDLVRLADFRHVHEAQLAASVLEAAEIDCVVRDQYTAGIRAYFIPDNVSLWVRRLDEERAREVLGTEGTEPAVEE